MGCDSGVGLAELTDRSHVERVVELAVAALGEPVNGATARWELHRCGPAVRRVVIAIAEPGDVAGVADQHRGDDRPHTEQLRERRC